MKNQLKALAYIFGTINLCTATALFANYTASRICKPVPVVHTYTNCLEFIIQPSTGDVLLLPGREKGTYSFKATDQECGY